MAEGRHEQIMAGEWEALLGEKAERAQIVWKAHKSWTEENLQELKLLEEEVQTAFAEQRKEKRDLSDQVVKKIDEIVVLEKQIREKREELDKIQQQQAHNQVRGLFLYRGYGKIFPELWAEKSNG